MPSLTALSSPLPLTKTLRLIHGTLHKDPYPMVRDFVSHVLPYTDTTTLAAALSHAATQHWCLLKGELDQPLLNEPRAGHTNPMAATDYVCLDFDGVTGSVDENLAKLGLANVSHVIQYSSSQGLVPDRLYCHVFMTLEHPVAAPTLKQWLTHLNFTAFEDQLALNKLGTALRWPLDITTCQNDKLLYICAPRFEGLADPVEQRVIPVLRDNPHIPARRFQFDVAGLETRKRDTLHKLRKAAGMPKLRDTQFKVLGSVEYLANPGRMQITGVHEARGYRYFNFNGGDSWAYYQSLEDIKFVFNFKGEPACLLSEIAPEYYAELQRAKRAEATAENEYFVFFSPQADSLFNAVLHKATGTVEAMQCGSERRSQIFLQNYGLDLPEVIPQYDLTYNPNTPTGIDNEHGVINTYVPPCVSNSEDRALPECVRNLIRHVVGDGAREAWFYQWLRYVTVEKKSTGIAVILHGIEGTGKGVLFQHIITPLLGASNATMVPLVRLMDSFNGWMENKLLIAVDEVETEAMGRQAKTVEANFKNWITEPTVSIRTMHRNARTAVNHTNWLLLSNRPAPMVVTETDRRFQVGRYQPKKIALGTAEIAELRRAVPAFWNWLQDLKPISLDELRTIIPSEDRARLTDLYKTTIDSVADHLLAGDLRFFFQHLPNLAGSTVDSAHTDRMGLSSDDQALIGYKQALHGITLRAANKPKQSYVTRDELHAVLNYLAGNIRRAPHHFTSLLKHHRIYLEAATPEGQPGFCLHVNWLVEPQWCLEMLKNHLADFGPRLKKVENAA